MFQLSSLLASRIKNLQIIEKGLLHPSSVFDEDRDEYSQFDELGIPTHDTAGAVLAKKARKKLQSRYENQVETHAKSLEKLQQTPTLIDDLTKEISDLGSQLNSL